MALPPGGERERPREFSRGLSLVRRSGGSDLRNVGGLRPFLALDDLELDSIALCQGLEARARDRAEVNEHVGASLAGNESEPLGVIEPLHGAGDTCHGTFPL